MRLTNSLPVAFLALAVASTSACGDQITAAEAPESTVSALQAGPALARQEANTGQATFGNLLAALNNVTANINNLQVLSDLIDAGDVNAEDVNVALVNIDDLDVNVVALNNALNRNDVDIDALQNFLNGVDITITDVLTNVLTNADILVTDVLAIGVNVGTGDIVIFHQ